MLPPSTPAQDDLRDCLAGRHWQTSQGGSSASYQAESRAPNPRTREELGIQEAASLAATTRGQTRATGPLLVQVLPGQHLVPQSCQEPWQPTPLVKAQGVP